MQTKLTCLMLLIFASILYSGTISGSLIYSDPLRNADYVNPSAAIILKFAAGNQITGVMNSGKIEIDGSISGRHEYDLCYSDDKSVVILKPNTKFSNGENVTVSSSSFEFEFRIRKNEIPVDPIDILNRETDESQSRKSVMTKTERYGSASLPQINVNYSSNADNGYIFVNNIVFNPSVPNTPYLLILKNNGTPFFARENPSNAYEMKVQPNGNITYYDAEHVKFMELDTAYNLIDSFYCGNGYSTDVHDLRILSNGHALLLSYDPETVDMSQVYPGGNPSATVTGLIIQEIDANKNVVFQWRSWDHFQITDATHEDFTESSIDYVHGNALEPDGDGNILLSSRHMDEITKINRQTGNIIWRFGGKNNQFALTGDPDVGFSHQHAIRRISDGNLTLFDNGNFHIPPHSRACEYSIDEVNKTAALVWQYRNSPDIYGNAMGYVQRLSNGNTFIGWGAANPTVTEVKPDGTKTYEMTFANGVYSYRAYRFNWKQTDEAAAIPQSFNLSQNYPNPFNPVTTIEVDIPAQSSNSGVDVKLEIYDLLGNKVTDLINAALPAGKYIVPWSGTGFSSGVYFYRLEAGPYTSTKKMMLVK